MDKKEYSPQELESDIKWFGSYGVSRSEAKDLIVYLLNLNPSKELNALLVAEKI